VLHEIAAANPSTLEALRQALTHHDIRDDLVSKALYDACRHEMQSAD
jgi:hypothetical protein